MKYLRAALPYSSLVPTVFPSIMIVDCCKRDRFHVVVFVIDEDLWVEVGFRQSKCKRGLICFDVFGG